MPGGGVRPLRGSVTKLPPYCTSPSRPLSQAAAATRVRRVVRRRRRSVLRGSRPPAARRSADDGPDELDRSPQRSGSRSGPASLPGSIRCRPTTSRTTTTTSSTRSTGRTASLAEPSVVPEVAERWPPPFLATRRRGDPRHESDTEFCTCTSASAARARRHLARRSRRDLAQPAGRRAPRLPSSRRMRRGGASSTSVRRQARRAQPAPERSDSPTTVSRRPRPALPGTARARAKPRRQARRAPTTTQHLRQHSMRFRD